MWVDHLSNGQAVRSVFGENIPELRGLELGQLILDSAGGLALALDLGGLPEPVPTRWTEKEFDRLQLRMRFAVDELAIRRNDAPAQKVSVELEDGGLRVVSEDGLFELTAGVIAAWIEFIPYRGSEYEFPPTWYSQY
jgi:hypothetical protein